MNPLDLYRQALREADYRALDAWYQTFYPFQRDWLFERARRAICNKSRQIGLSHTTSAVAVLWGVFHGELTTIISVGQDESDEVLDKAKRHAELLRRLGCNMAKTRSDNATEIVFESGGRIISLPSSGGRGFTGNVFLDEYAYQEHAGKVWDAAAAVTLLGFRLRVASTPNGVGNEFEVLWRKSVEQGWARHEIPIQTAIDQGYPVDLKECWSLAKGDPRLFDQLFNCRFLDGEAQYIPTALVNQCSTDDLYTWEGDYYAGLDIGRTADLTALVVVRMGADRIRRVQHIETCKRTDIDTLHAMVDRAFQRFQLRRLCVDSSGMGAFPAEQMQRRHGRQRVEPVVFTTLSKEDLATSLYQAFADTTVLIPRDDQTLSGLTPGSASKMRDDLCSLRRIITTAGNVRYDAPHTDEGHADRAWALALALYGCNQGPNVRHVAEGR